MFRGRSTAVDVTELEAVSLDQSHILSGTLQNGKGAEGGFQERKVSFSICLVCFSRLGGLGVVARNFTHFSASFP